MSELALEDVSQKIERVVVPQARPVVAVLSALGVVAAGAIILFVWGSDYVKGVQAEGLKPTVAAQAIQQKQLDDHEARLRVLETTVTQTATTVGEIKSDVHELVTRARKQDN